MAVVVEAPTVKPFSCCCGRVVQKDAVLPLVIVVALPPVFIVETHRYMPGASSP